MSLRIRLLVVALATIAVVASAAVPASASRSFSVVGGGRAISGVSSGGITFAGASGTNIIANATLTGSVHSLIGKARGALLGVITRAQFSECRSNIGVGCSITALLPMHVTGQSFTGTLPRITGSNVSFEFTHRVDLERLRCLYAGALEARSEGRAGAAEFTIEGQSLQAGNSVPLFRAEGEEFFRRCSSGGELRGALRISPTVTIKLH